MRSAAAAADPGWVDAILDWPGTWPLSRVALTSAFWIGGLTKLLDFPSAVAEQAHFGLRPAALFAVLTIVVELAGSALVISGRLVWLGAGALGVFTALATLLAHDFWAMAGEARFQAMNSFFEHLGLIAGMVMAARLGERRRTS
jgi:uncharacterized membrane protein YphA (DoxX/SURF4 family)